MENPLIAGFVEKQHEEKLGHGAAKRLRAKQALLTRTRTNTNSYGTKANAAG
jgi:hypothetical protein